jgi:hypothetical protein
MGSLHTILHEDLKMCKAVARWITKSRKIFAIRVKTLLTYDAAMNDVFIPVIITMEHYLIWSPSPILSNRSILIHTTKDISVLGQV